MSNKASPRTQTLSLGLRGSNSSNSSEHLLLLQHPRRAVYPPARLPVTMEEQALLTAWTPRPGQVQLGLSVQLRAPRRWSFGHPSPPVHLETLCVSSRNAHQGPGTRAHFRIAGSAGRGLKLAVLWVPVLGDWSKCAHLPTRALNAGSIPRNQGPHLRSGGVDGRSRSPGLSPFLPKLQRLSWLSSESCAPQELLVG